MSESNYRAALRQMLEAELRCPHCDAENSPGQPLQIELEDGAERAGCTHCGCYGGLAHFRRPRKEGIA